MKFYSLDGLTQVCPRKPALHFESLSHGGSLLYIPGLREQHGKYSVDHFPTLLEAALLAALKYIIEARR